MQGREKMKKSISSITLVTLVVFTMLLAACAQPAATPAEAPAPSEPTQAPAEPTKAPVVELTEAPKEEPTPADCLIIGVTYVGSITDAGFNQAMHDSVMEVKKNIPCVKIIEAENVPETADAEKTMQTMIDQGAKLIFPTSFGHQEFAFNLSKTNPDVIFEHVGGYMMSDNFANFFGKPPETFYIMGAAAGLVTQSNKLGFVAAFPMGWSITFINAFELGAQSTNPDAETIVNWTFSWSDSAKEAAAADALINQGVDVITMHVDAPGTIIQTAESRGVYSIGYQSLAAQQFAPEYWLSGVGFTLGGKMTWFAQSVMDGTWEPIFLRCGLADGCMAIAPFGPKVPQEAQDKVTELSDLLNAGNLVVFKGPIVDQEGTIRIAEGEVLGDQDMGNVDWFVKGVIGNPK
jgi:basic membrane lipoprotein Med (substrate-binding protein (PBP1-ABC) superfamily)